MNRLFDVINVVGVILEIMIALTFFNTISNKKQFPTYIEKFLNIICIAVQSVVIIIIDKQTVISIILFFIMIVLSLQYNLIWLKRILFSGFLMILYILSEIAIGLILTIIYKVSVEQLSSNILFYTQGVLIAKLIMFVVMKIVGFFSFKSEIKVSKYVFLPLIALPLATFLVVYIMSEFMFIEKPGVGLTLSTIAIISLIISNILVFYMFEYQLKINENEKQEHIIKQELRYKAEYYKELSRRQQITNKTMHDLKNQLFALREIYKNDPVEGMDRIDTICEELLNTYTLKFTGIESVDALITSKFILMREKNIEFSNSIYLSEKNYIDTVDLCVLLGNLLDNAIEANGDVNIKDKYINLDIRQQINYLSIKISNSKKEIINIVDNRIVTTKKHKELHGIGLKSVREIVKKYDGNCLFQQDKNKFEAIILLKNK